MVRNAKHLQFRGVKHVCSIVAPPEVVGDPFGDTKEDKSVGEAVVKRRGIVLAHQATGKLAGIVGTAMIASAARPATYGRQYSMLQRRDVKRKGIKPSKNVVYFPQRGPLTQIAAERKHLNRIYGKRVTRGPKKGKILRGDELRNYPRQRVKATAGGTLVAYSKTAKVIGYGHAYGLRPRGLIAPVDYIVEPGLLKEDVGAVKRGIMRSHRNTQRVGQAASGLAVSYAILGGSEGVKSLVIAEGIKYVFS